MQKAIKNSEKLRLIFKIRLKNQIFFLEII